MRSSALRASPFRLLVAIMFCLSLAGLIAATGCGVRVEPNESTVTTPTSENGATTISEKSPATEATTASSTSDPGLTTTTAKLSTAESVLDNGHITAMGYIDKVWEEGGKRFISIDYAQMLTGKAAVDAAVKAGIIKAGESLDNDYWISNENKQKRTFEVSGSVAITTSTRWVDGDDMGAPCTWTDFKSFWGPGPLAESEAHLNAAPWWIERDGQVVVKIDEQFIP
jgi:hypothetical protein